MVGKGLEDISGLAFYPKKEEEEEERNKRKKNIKKFANIRDLIFAGNFCTQIFGNINQDQSFFQAGYAYSCNFFSL